MVKLKWFPSLPCLFMVLLLAPGCNEDTPTAPGNGSGEGVFGLMPDFSILDLNPTSITAGQNVSPRDYLEKVSGWYFGSAT